MGTIMPAAANIQPIQQPDILENYGHILQIRNLLQNAPLQHQILQQQAEGGQMQNQQMHQDIADQQSFRQAMQDPSMKGKTIGQVADTLAQSGKISQKAWAAAKEADLKSQQTLGTMADNNLKTLDTAYKTTQPIYDSVQKMDDATLQANWPTIAQQYDAIWQPVIAANPQLKQNMPMLDPNQPMTKAQLAQFGPMLSMGQAYTDAENKRRQDAADLKLKEAQAAEKEMEVNAGGSGAMADARYRKIVANQTLGLPVSPEDKAWLTAYQRQKTLVPVANFNLQANGLGGNTQLTPAQQATKEAILEGRMTPPSSFALRTPYWQAVMGGVFQDDPQFSEQRAELRKDFTVGKHSTEINAINTAMGHIGVLNDAIDALNNGNVKALNQLANSLGVQVGNDKVTTFNTIVHRVGPEIAKAYVGSGGSAGERGSDEKDFDPSLGPQQLRSNAAITAQLFRSKISAFENQWNQNKSENMPSFQERFIMPEAQRTLDKIAPQAGASPAVSGGVSVTAPNGKTYTFKTKADADSFKQRAGIR